MPFVRKRFILAVPALMLAAGVGTVSCGAPSRPANFRADHRLLLRLYDRGSTNTPAWVLTVNMDGSGALADDDTGSGRGNKDFNAGTFDSRSLTAALDKIDVGHLPGCTSAEATAPVEVNSGSASFGSSATLYYKGELIKSFCLNSPAESAITSQLSKVVATANP